MAPPSRSELFVRRSPFDVVPCRGDAELNCRSSFAPRRATGRSSRGRSVRAAALLAASALLSSDLAFAQQIIKGVKPCSDVKYAGTYHVATGVFDASGSSSSSLVVPGVIYRNDCDVRFFSPIENDDSYIDEGRIPSTTSPVPNQGTVDNYHVTSFQLSYCTEDVTGVFSIRVRFWDQYASCTPTSGAGTPTGDFLLTGLPGSATAGVLDCFTVDVDVTGAGFCLRADADETFNGDAVGNRFGYGLSMQGQTVSGVGGFILAGNPAACSEGVGTYYNSPGTLLGTGLGNVDRFRIEGGPTPPGCYYYGGDPFSGFYLVITANVSDGSSCSAPACALLATTPVVTPVPGPPAGGARGDLDGDGDRDLVTADGAAGSITMLYNSGTGSFPLSVTRSMPGGSVTAAAIGDLNGDGRNDVVAGVTDPAACSPGSTIVAS